MQKILRIRSHFGVKPILEPTTFCGKCLHSVRTSTLAIIYMFYDEAWPRTSKQELTTTRTREKQFNFHTLKLLLADIGRYNIIDIISYHYITFSRILIFLYHFLKGDIFVI
jgi:hypothetical protein